MSRDRFSVTYEITTPESAEAGDAAEAGFASSGGWKHDDRALMDLRSAISNCGYYPRAARPGCGGFEDCGRWFATLDADQNYRTGEETRYALHPPADITPASYARLRRYLTGRSR
jgi:hypothetical protein